MMSEFMQSASASENRAFLATEPAYRCIEQPITAADQALSETKDRRRNRMASVQTQPE
jgi:hypothetical protein